MTVEGHKVASLHGAKDSRERDAIIDGFREGRDKVLCHFLKKITDTYFALF